jgi:hypothetical protein
MSETITYTSLTNLLSDSSITAAKAEAVLIQAINMLVTEGAAIDALTGAEGSRTGTYTQAEAGAILQMAVAVYAQMYKQAGASASAYNIGGISSSQSASASGGAGSLQALAKELAKRLKGSSIALVVAEDTSGLG